MLHELKPVSGSRTKRKRIGRGIGSGFGKTAGKGHKGQRARSGNQPRPGFEGGQIPFFQRIPKRGFNSPNRVENAVVNVEDLNVFKEGTTVTPHLLVEQGLIRNVNQTIKILGNGTLEQKLVVQAHKFSKSAQSLIEQVGGTVEVI